MKGQSHNYSKYVGLQYRFRIFIIECNGSVVSCDVIKLHIHSIMNEKNWVIACTATVFL